MFMFEKAFSQEWEMATTVYPKKYAHGFCFAVLCCGYTLTDFPISIRLTSLALWQSNDCPSASKATLMNMDKYFMWIHYERLHNHNKAKHNKTVCIFLGIYCMAGRMDLRNSGRVAFKPQRTTSTSNFIFSWSLSGAVLYYVVFCCVVWCGEVWVVSCRGLTWHGIAWLRMAWHGTVSDWQFIIRNLHDCPPQMNENLLISNSKLRSDSDRLQEKMKFDVLNMVISHIVKYFGDMLSPITLRHVTFQTLV